jgi:hypothetical protein
VRHRESRLLRPCYAYVFMHSQLDDFGEPTFYAIECVHYWGFDTSSNVRLSRLVRTHLCAAIRVNLLKRWEKRNRPNTSICSYFASIRKLQQSVAPPLHGGGQGFESPRLHSKKC